MVIGDTELGMVNCDTEIEYGKSVIMKLGMVIGDTETGYSKSVILKLGMVSR